MDQTKQSDLRERVTRAIDEAVLLQSRGETDRPRLLYKGALAHDPLNAIALCNLAVLLKGQREFSDAVVATKKAAIVKPATPAAYNNLGNSTRELNEAEKSVKYGRYCNVLAALYPDNHNNCALSYTHIQKYEEALLECKKALTLNPAFPDAWLNYSNSLVLSRQGKNSAKYYRKATLLRPRHHTTLSSFGVALAAMGYMTEATTLQEQTLGLNKEHENAQFNLALYYLGMGRFKEGFTWYETGIGGQHANNKRGNHRRVGQPRWKGEPLTGKTLVVTAEQGIGDEIMFASVLTEVARTAKKVYYEVTPRLYELMTRSLPNVHVFKYNPDDPNPILRDQSIDYSLPLGSIPKYFRQALYAFGRQRPYLEPNIHLARYFRAKYEKKFGKKLFIGINWKGGSGLLRSAGRSTSLQRFAPIINMPGVQAVSIQYGDVKGTIEHFNSINQGQIHWDPEVDPLTSIEASAAQIASLDIVISVTNAAVHCAGAMGVPCWILVPRISDWRWTWGREDVIWYPGMRCFRQKVVGDWSHPFGQVIQELETYLATGNGLRASPAPDMDWSGDL